MNWYEARFEVSEEASEALAEQLIQLGAWGVATQDPYELKRLLNAPDATLFVDPAFLADLPDFVRISAYFAAPSDQIRLVPLLADEENPFLAIERRLYGETADRYVTVSELEDLLRACLEKVGTYLNIAPARFTLTPIQEEDWANSWKQYYQPLEINEHLMVCPSWIETKTKPGQIQLKLDPGSAFGTGSHETTALCLRLLTHYIWEGDRDILDLGCGSGILGIAAILLGAESVEALDLDPGAVRVTQENATKNGVSDQLEAHVGSLTEAYQADYSLVLANLLAEVLVELQPQLKARVKPGGYLICSGIVNTKVTQIDEAFEESHWTLMEHREAQDWIARVYQRKA